jgi:hypothetical protein
MPDVPDSQPKTHSRSVGETVSTGDSVTATVSRAATEIKYSTSSQNALRLAEGVRTHLGDGQVTTEMLLYGLAAKTNGAAQAFVAVRQGAEPVVRIAAEFGWKEIRTTRVERLPEEFTPNASRVLDIAKTFATRGRVRDRHLFAAILEVPESLACRWLTRIFEPDVPMDLVRRALREWPPDQVFTVGTVSVALQKRQANEVQSPPAAASVAPQLGGILSEASCQLIVLPCSSAGTTSEWVEDIIREYGLVHPRPMPFGTLSEAERRDGRTFVFASSVEDQTSNVAAIRTIGVALGQLATSKQLDVIGTPLLGAGTNPNGRERIPAEMSFQALAAGFREGATRASLLLVLIPEKERFQRIQRSLAIADTGQGAGAVKTPDWASRAYLATHASDVAEGNDLLSLRREVDALSALLVSTSVEPPVSVGLFGEWGSGKSFFMKELSDSIAARAAASKETKDDLFCANVVQIKFNAR